MKIDIDNYVERWKKMSMKKLMMALKDCYLSRLADDI